MDREDRIEEILADWCERRDRGEEVSPEEVIRTHSEFAEDLREHFEALRFVDGALEESYPSPQGMPGEIGDFRIIREIGRGGMGTVYEAEQTSMGRRVALKVLSPSVTGARQAIRRFQREARAAGRLRHPNIVPVYGMGKDRGLYFYAMELVEGRSLGEAVAEMKACADSSDSWAGPPGTTTQSHEHFEKLAKAMAGVADALQAAHGAGILHRDVKPTNLLLAEDGTLKLVDFGLARLAGDEGSMTVTGQILGTPHYMSPEQARAKQVAIDHRTDIYSLGATLYELLTLETPFQGESFPEVCSQILTVEPPPPRKVNPRVPRDLETIVQKSMEKESERRYGTAAELAADLRRFAEGAPIRARRVGIPGRTWRRVRRNKVRAALAAGVLLAAAAGVFFAVLASRESERRLDLEYAALCAEAEEEVARSWAWLPDPGSGLMIHADEGAGSLFTRAIELRPERPEAWLGRALSPGRTVEQCLADLDAAGSRGLPEGVRRLGRAYLLRVAGRADEAEAEERLAPTEPESPAECYYRALLEAAGGRTDRALTLLDRAVEEAEGPALRFLSLCSRARLRNRAGNHPGALRDLSAVEAMGDTCVYLRLSMATTLMRMERHAEAEAEFERALAQIREVDDPEAWEAFCAVCRPVQNWHSRATEEALERYAEADQLLQERLLALRRDARFSELVDLCRRLESRHPENHTALEMRALALVNLGRFEEALPAVGRAIELEPGCAAARNTRGNALHQLRRYEEALEAYERSIELGPDRPEAYMNRGLTLSLLDRPEEALAAYDLSLEKKPELALAHANRALTLCALERWEEALPAADRAVELAPLCTFAQGARSRALLGVGRFEEALVAADRAIAIAPGWAGPHSERGLALNCLYRFDEALPAFRRALELDPVSPHNLCNLGLALANVGAAEAALPLVDRFLESSPDDAEGHLVRSLALSAAERYDEALEAADRAVSLDGEEAGAHRMRAYALAALGRDEESLRVLDRAIELDPMNAPARSGRGETLTRLGRLEEALEELDRAVAIDPPFAGAFWSRCYLCYRMERYEQALVDLDRSCELDPSRLEVPGTWSVKAVSLRTLGRPAEALPCYDRWVELEPESCDAHIGRGLALADLGRFDEALRAYFRAITLEPERVSPHHLRGLALHELKRHDEAMGAFDRVLELDPDHVGALLNRGAILCDQRQDYEGALGAFDRIVSIEPENATAHFNRGEALTRLGRAGEAVDAYRQAVEVNPGYAEAHVRIGLLLEREPARLEDALAAFTRAVEVDPDNLPAHGHRAKILSELERFGEAVAAFERLLELDPQNLWAIINRAALLSDRLSRYEEAAEAFSNAIRIDPRNALLHSNLGTALGKLGKHEKALESFDRSLELDPGRQNALRNKAVSLRALGRLEEALEAARGIEGLDGAVRRIGLLRDLARHEEAESLARECLESAPEGADPAELAWLCAQAGERDRALEILGSHEEPRTPGRMYQRACILALLGEPDAALEWLASAAEAGHRLRPGGPPDPDFASLAGDPRYRVLLERLTNR